MAGLTMQILNMLAAILLLITFAMLGQRRILSMVHLFRAHGVIVVASSLVAAYMTGNHHLYISAALTFVVKVVVVPWLLYRLVHRLNAGREIERLISIPTTMLIGLFLVIVAFNLAMPIAALSTSITSSTLGIALACIFLALMMMMVRSNAIPQVIGFLTVENGLFFAASAATDGMPMIVELGVALAVVGGTLVVGLFVYQIREHFDDLNIQNLEPERKD